MDPPAIHQVVAGEFVTAEDGTGIVHQAPYGADDWETARAHRMPLPEAVGAEGRLRCATSGRVAARHVLQGRRRAADGRPEGPRAALPEGARGAQLPALLALRHAALLLPGAGLVHRDHGHQAAHARAQRPRALGPARRRHRALRRVAREQRRLEHLARPLLGDAAAVLGLLGPSCGAEEAFGSAAELQERSERPLPAGFDHHKPSIDDDRVRLRGQGLRRDVMRRTSAVLDCWFDSGAMPYAQYGWPHLPGSRERVADQFPADFICEGVDQTRGWFYTLHAIGAFVTGQGEGPRRRAGLRRVPGQRPGARQGRGQDVQAPGQRGRPLGAPAPARGRRRALVPRRLGGARGCPSASIPRASLEVRRRFFRALLQSYDGFFRVYAEIDGFDPRRRACRRCAERPAIDRWLVSRTQSVVARARACYAEHDFTGALRAIEDFIADELSNWYIRRNRRALLEGRDRARQALGLRLAATGPSRP